MVEIVTRGPHMVLFKIRGVDNVDRPTPQVRYDRDRRILLIPQLSQLSVSDLRLYAQDLEKIANMIEALDERDCR